MTFMARCMFKVASKSEIAYPALQASIELAHHGRIVWIWEKGIMPYN